MKIQYVTKQNYNSNTSFTAKKLIVGNMDTLYEIHNEFLNAQNKGLNPEKVINGIIPPNFEYSALPLDGNSYKTAGKDTVLLVTENDAIELHKITTQAFESDIRTGNDFTKFILEKFNIPDKAEDAIEFLKALKGKYNHAKLEVEE